MLLENIKEKSLEKSPEQQSIIPSEAIKKLKEKIIGKSDKGDEVKGKQILSEYIIKY